jgi:hypothetical protein
MTLPEPPDLRAFLQAWPYVPGRNVRLVRLASGREIMLVRQPAGLEQYEVAGRPDGTQPEPSPSLLDLHTQRLLHAQQFSDGSGFGLAAGECDELLAEARLYFQRLILFCRLGDWPRGGSDACHALRVVEFVTQHALHVEDRAQLDLWRPRLLHLHTLTRALALLAQGDVAAVLPVLRASALSRFTEIDLGVGPEDLRAALLQELQPLLELPDASAPREEAVFRREADYWTITYEGRTVRLKATRGMQCLVCLLRHPGYECHVSELATLLNAPHAHADGHCVASAAATGLACPVLDDEAKTQYRRRLVDLQAELAEADRFNDTARATCLREEIDCIADQISAATGLGGRDRQAGSNVERARSAITKRIRDAIHRIAEVHPPLGSHLLARVKTGYFCSYNPHPDHVIRWRL